MASPNNIFQGIKRSQQFELAWSKKSAPIRHTAIAVILDDKPTYTIDYGAPRAGKLLPSGNAGVEINLFKRENKIQGSLCKFSIGDSSRKATATNLINKILNIQMGKYKLTKNNCRTFVEKAAEIIGQEEVGFSPAQLQQFQHQLNQIRKTDKLLTNAAVGVGAALIGTVVGASSKQRK